MTEAQKRYIELEKEYQAQKPFRDQFAQATKDLFNELGDGGHFQDEEGTVYKASRVDGKWVSFSPEAINRTRRPGEAKGSLSLTEAKADGYEVQ